MEVGWPLKMTTRRKAYVSSVRCTHIEQIRGVYTGVSDFQEFLILLEIPRSRQCMECDIFAEKSSLLCMATFHSPDDKNMGTRGSTWGCAHDGPDQV